MPSNQAWCRRSRNLEFVTSHNNSRILVNKSFVWQFVFSLTGVKDTAEGLSSVLAV